MAHNAVATAAIVDGGNVWATAEPVVAIEDGKGERHVADVYIASCHPAEILRLTGPGGMRASLAERVLKRRAALKEMRDK